MKPAIRIVDLDRTITDDTWRYWLIDPSLPDTDPNKYYAYHLHCGGDTVINRYIVDESPVDVFFLTARHEYVRKQTTDWLHNNHFKYKALIMRYDHNHVPSAQMKRQAVQSLMHSYQIEKAYDDREDIINAYAELGVEGMLVV
jgi:hypothetical protein